MFDLSFYKGKKVLVTGHTGFKGSWMTKALLMAGAQVIGYALPPETEESLFMLLGLEKEQELINVTGDISDLDMLMDTFKKYRPEIVIHMAAQPIVRESYKNPVYTYQTNVMGTVNVMECVRLNEFVRSVVNVTTDKVYLNREWEWGYRENEELNGYDPYSNSKSCSELVTDSYRNSFLKDMDIAVSTLRAGNVIGGGDFATDRIIPDCVRAALKGEDIVVRNPYSTRPYQHVLEPVMVYLRVAMMQYENHALAGAYNIGPDDIDCLNTGELVDLFCNNWEKITGNKIAWINKHDGGPHEANLLKLDSSKIKKTFGWSPVWHMDTVMEKIAEWTYAYHRGEDVVACMNRQIEEFCNG